MLTVKPLIFKCDKFTIKLRRQTYKTYFGTIMSK